MFLVQLGRRADAVADPAAPTVAMEFHLDAGRAR